MPPESNHDEQLLKRARRGNEAAFAELYRRRQGELYRFALQMTGSEAIAEDVVQEVFLTVIRTIDAFDTARGSVRAWLYGIARNCVLRQIGRQAQAISLHELIGYEPAALSTDDDRVESIEAVRRAVIALPQPFREAVVLCDLEELTYMEAADAMSVPVGTIRSRLSRGRALLGQILRSGISRCLV